MRIRTSLLYAFEFVVVLIVKQGSAELVYLVKGILIRAPLDKFNSQIVYGCIWLGLTSDILQLLFEN